MTWQVAILLQVVASSFLAIFTRQISLSVRRVFFGVGLFSYIAVGVMGALYAVVALRGLPALPAGDAWRYILLEGICIPASWLVTYQLVRHIGAGNAVIATTVNGVAAATAGILFLGDSLKVSFLVGAGLISASALLSLRIRPDTKHKDHLSMIMKALLLLAGATFFAVGMYGEKQAISLIGVWRYTTYGWGMQAVGAGLLFLLFGRKEWQQLRAPVISRGLLLGLVTSIAGVLYVYALSKGELSHTIIAASGRIAITLVLASLILRERNAFGWRALAFALSVGGLILIL